MKATMWQQMVIGWTSIATLVTLGATAEAGTMVRRTARAQRMETSQEAGAALTAVGAASGWGRIKVEDKVRLGVVKREVEVELFDMDPMTELSIEADGVSLGNVRTDASGWATLKLETDDNSHPPVPSDLPPAGDLSAASVRDVSGAFVLDGSFVGFNAGDDDSTVHEEKIKLTDQMGVGASGVAKVEREADGTQEFDTRATGLTPGETYTVRVDGFAAGMATADAVGQARLKFEFPDDENPLPSELQPIEDLRVVEWYDENDDLLLAGVFTGLSNDDDDEDGSGSGNDDDGDDDGDDDDSTVHEEEISLTDHMGVGASGGAKVERESDGTQEFDTWAAGLRSGETYTISVDGFTAGMVTADAVGRARLKFESSDDENPLPTELQPVEELRVVEWSDENGELVLSGTFSGVSNDDDDDDDDGNGGSGSGGHGSGSGSSGGGSAGSGGGGD